ncbi:MAG TPA: hypothetical protein EYP04_07330 [Anaerolineae bacterium]|nr:hypothetical protein [Anaerolineae bacterium]
MAETDVMRELEELSADYKAALADQETRLKELENLRTRLMTEMAELERRLADVEEQLADERQALEQAQKNYRRRRAQVLQQRLRADAEEIARRSALWLQAEARRQQLLQDLQADPELAQLWKEYHEFESMRSQLAEMPETYRRALEELHHQREKRLRLYLMADDMPELAGLEPWHPSFLACKLPGGSQPGHPDQHPTSFAVVLPIPYNYYTQGADAPQDLACALAYQWYGALVELSHGGLGAEEAPDIRNAGGFIACLTELPLDNGDTESDLCTLAAVAVDERQSRCPPARASRLHSVQIIPVDPEDILALLEVETT